jgi:hypothetical protein
MSHAGGHPAEPVMEAWAMRFGLTHLQRWRVFTPKMCWQLCQCRGDEQRRLILGVSA